MTTELRVAMRADASAQIGTGHVTRCAALARALLDSGATARFVTRRHDLDIEPLLNAPIECTYLPTQTQAAPARGPVAHAAWAGVDWEVDAAATIAASRDWLPSHIVVDHYSFDARWHRMVADALGASVVVIDDLADRQLDGALLVDQNLAGDHRQKYGERWPRDRPLLGGPRFALLDGKYTRAPRVEVGPAVGSIGIFMGGTDAQAYSARVLTACREIVRFAGDIEIVSTGANPHLEALRQLCNRWPRTRLTSDLPDLASFHARHDLQVGAGGGASWERCCVGVPALVIATAENQRVVVDGLVRAGAAAASEPSAFPDEAAIGAAVLRLLGDPALRASLSRNARQLVDGLGAARVALCIAADSLSVRPANALDAEHIYEWRNHPATRAVSRHHAEISWETHRGWYERALADPARRLLIATIAGRDVGVIRFDRRDDGYHEISLFLDPALHGLGLGRRMLGAGEAALEPDARFRAFVIEDNLRSQEMFAAAGYIRESPGVWLKSRQACRTRGKSE